eukprot:Em0004g1260a
MKPLYPKPHRNQLLEGLRPTLELNTFHRWPGVSCSPLPQGLHQTLLPLQLKLKGLAVRQRRCPGQRASQGSNSVTEYWLAIHKSLPKSQASFDLFSNLSICLIRANARAILRRV